jgi:LAS superfamily LD-carboxypeptidase LdcB
VAVPGPVPLTTVRGITVHTTISAQLDAMVAAAAADGVQLSGSGYRSHDRQIELRRQHCGTSDYAIFEMPSSQCSPPTARPGSSLHEQGLAVDFVNCSSHSTACYQWLNGHASGYGFFNLPSEPWHWSIDGR